MSRVSRRPASYQRTYGNRRYQPLAAYTNGLLLLAITVAVVFEAAQRFIHPAQVNGRVMLVVAVAGGIANLAAFLILSGGSSLNERGARAHVLSDLLGSLDRGEFDATLLDLARFDAYRAAHRDNRLAATGYYYPIGVNRGYVALASDAALLDGVNKALADLQARGTVADLARAAGLTYLPPREPVVLGDVLQQILAK